MTTAFDRLLENPGHAPPWLPDGWEVLLSLKSKNAFTPVQTVHALLRGRLVYGRPRQHLARRLRLSPTVDALHAKSLNSLFQVMPVRVEDHLLT